jgi:beta-lactamase regulating signal transducer with metallopeptidase domain
LYGKDLSFTQDNFKGEYPSQMINVLWLLGRASLPNLGSNWKNKIKNNNNWRAKIRKKKKKKKIRIKFIFFIFFYISLGLGG